MGRHFSVIHFSVPLLSVAMALTGCNSSDAPTAKSPGGSKGTIGVSVLTMTNPFFQVIAQNLEAELKKAGYKTVVVAGEFDVAKQDQQVRDFLTAGDAAIV